MGQQFYTPLIFVLLGQHSEKANNILELEQFWPCGSPESTLKTTQESTDHTVRTTVLVNWGTMKITESGAGGGACKSGDWLPLWMLEELQAVGKSWAAMGQGTFGRTGYVSPGIWESCNTEQRIFPRLGCLAEGAEEQWERETLVICLLRWGPLLWSA